MTNKKLNKEMGLAVALSVNEKMDREYYSGEIVTLTYITIPTYNSTETILLEEFKPDKDFNHLMLVARKLQLISVSTNIKTAYENVKEIFNFSSKIERIKQ